MAAISTARRHRWRTGFVRQSTALYEQVLTDSLDVADNPIPIYTRIVPGDRIDSVTDSSNPIYTQGPGIFDSLAVSDSITLYKSTSPKLIDTIDVTDSAEQLLERNRALISLTEDDQGVPAIIDNYFADKIEYQDPQVTNFVTIPSFNNDFVVTDNVIATPVLAPAVSTVKPFDSIVVNDSIVVAASKLNQRLFADSVNLIDTFRVTITRNFPIIIKSRIQFDAVDVTDAFSAAFTGISQRILSDSITATDASKYGKFDFDVTLDTLDVSDAFVKTVLAIDAETIDVTDDIIVSRSAILNNVVVAESFAVIDRSDATYTEFIQVSAEIVIGIEVQ